MQMKDIKKFSFVVGLISFFFMGLGAWGEEAQDNQGDHPLTYEYTGDLKEKSWSSGKDSGKDGSEVPRKDVPKDFGKEDDEDSVMPPSDYRPLQQLELSFGSVVDSIHERPDKNDALVIASRFQPAINLEWKYVWNNRWFSFVKMGMIFKNYKDDDDGIGELTGKEFIQRDLLLGMEYIWDEVSFVGLGVGLRAMGSPKKRSRGSYLLERNRSLTFRSRFSQKLLIPTNFLSLSLLGELGRLMKGNKTFKGGWNYGGGLGLKLKSPKSLSLPMILVEESSFNVSALYRHGNFESRDFDYDQRWFELMMNLNIRFKYKKR